jgi:hypothetical protein
MDSLVKKLAPKIVQLSYRGHIPVVVVRASSIPNSGNGVYATSAISAGEVCMCLFKVSA